MERKRVVVLGCGGFVGSHLIDRMLGTGRYEVFGFDTSSRKCAEHLGDPNFHFKETYVDATNVRAEIEPLLDDCDTVISLAAVCNPAQYVANPLFTIESNFIDAYKLVEVCAERGAWIIHTSTCEVYGRTIASYLPHNDYGNPDLYEQFEDRTPLVMGPVRNQRWCYAAAKALLERYIYANHTERGLPFTIVRPYNWLGPRMDFIPGRDGEGTPRVMACFMAALLGRKPLQLVDGGHAWRTVTYIDDAIDAMMRILEQPERSKNQFFNVGNRGGEITMVDLAHRMRAIYAEITGDESFRRHRIENVTSEEFYGAGYEDCDRRVPDISRAEDLLGWRAKTDLDETLRRTMAHFHRAYGDPSATPKAIEASDRRE